METQVEEITLLRETPPPTLEELKISGPAASRLSTVLLQLCLGCSFPLGREGRLMKPNTTGVTWRFCYTRKTKATSNRGTALYAVVCFNRGEFGRLEPTLFLREGNTTARRPLQEVELTDWKNQTLLFFMRVLCASGKRELLQSPVSNGEVKNFFTRTKTDHGQELSSALGLHSVTETELCDGGLTLSLTPASSQLLSLFQGMIQYARDDHISVDRNHVLWTPRAVSAKTLEPYCWSPLGPEDVGDELQFSANQFVTLERWSNHRLKTWQESNEGLNRFIIAMASSRSIYPAMARMLEDSVGTPLGLSEYKVCPSQFMWSDACFLKDKWLDMNTLAGPQYPYWSTTTPLPAKQEPETASKIMKDQGWPKQVRFAFWVFLGHALLTQPKDSFNPEMSMYLYGIGGTGKSSLRNLIANCFHESDHWVFGTGDSAGFLTGSLERKRFVCFSETARDSQIPSSMIKTLISREKVTVNEKQKVAFNCPFDGNVVLGGNSSFWKVPVQKFPNGMYNPEYKSELNHVQALARRVIVFTCGNEISIQDERLKSLLEEEQPIHVRTAIEAFLFVQNSNLRFKDVVNPLECQEMRNHLFGSNLIVRGVTDSSHVPAWFQ